MSYERFEQIYEDEGLVIYSFRERSGLSTEFIVQRTIGDLWIGRCCGETIVKGRDKESVINSCEQWMKEN